MRNRVNNKFIEKFGEAKGVRTFFSPGRVNLIGEHTDYNGGNVFPCALDFGTYGAIALRDDNIVRLYSENFDGIGIVEFSLDNLVNDKNHDWANYPKGVISVLKDNGYDINRGFDISIYGNIPNGSGLSSSASLELLVAVMINDTFKFNIDRINLVKFCQRAENEFIGVNCGIMDQFAIGMGKKDSAILLDCSTVDYTYSEVKLKDEVIVIANTNKRRGLADSKYNERRKECEQAIKELNKELKINSLGELTIEQFESHKHLIKDPVVTKRARHAVYENQRTLSAIKALRNSDIVKFGELMNESHISLRDDYEVTGKELDTLVSLAWKHEGTIGSRMTGAGFGGCTVSIVKKDKYRQFIQEVGQKYEQQIGYAADFYVANIGDGTREI